MATVPGGEFVYANRMFAEIMGMAGRSDVALGEYAAPYGICGRDGAPYPEERMPFVLAVQARETVLVDDIVIHRTDGRKVYVRAQARPVFDEAGAMTHVVIAFIDISPEVIAQKARAESEARLFSAQKMESIGNLAGGIAHDFNNLLATIKLLVAVLRSGETEDWRLTSLGQIDQVTDSAVRLTRALLGFARRGRNLASPVAVGEVVRSLSPIVERTLGRQVEVETRIEGPASWIVGDFSQLEQVVMNLVVNARDAMPDGGTLTMRVECTRTPPCPEPPPSPTGEYVVLEVSDTGTGIDPAIRDRIFEPYFTTKTRTGTAGFGLGLATVHGIVHGHGGTIEVIDRAPKGITMRVTLPAIDPPPRTSEPPAPVTSLHPGKGTILLVDDEEMLLVAAARAIRSLGYKVETAVDGQDAVEKFRERPDAYAAVLLDMIMPRMDGRATFLALQEIRPDVRVLLTTGYAFNEEAQRILDLGVRGFIAKPFSLEGLSEALDRVIGRPTPAPTP